MSTFAPPVQRERRQQRPPEAAAMPGPAPGPNLDPNQFQPPPPTDPPQSSGGTPSWYRPRTGGTPFWNDKSGYGTNSDQYNTRTFLAGHNIAVGKSAFENQSQANPNVQRMSWKDLAAAAGITDFQGAKRDPRFEALKSAFYGHVNNAEGNEAERRQYADALRQSLGQRFGEVQEPGSGGGPGGGGGGLGLEGEAGDFIRKLMSGTEGPYTAEVQANMRADAAARRSSDLQNQQRDAYLASVRGSGTTGPAGAAIQAANQRAAQGGLARDVAGIRNEATQANFGARLQGLNQAQTMIQRQYEDRWNKAKNDTDRYRIEQEYDAQMKKIEADKEMAQQQINASAAAGGAARGFEREMFDLRNQRADFEYQRDLPFQLMQYGMGALGGA